jgi:hypothetical protein
MSHRIKFYTSVFYANWNWLQQFLLKKEVQFNEPIRNLFGNDWQQKISVELGTTSIHRPSIRRPSVRRPSIHRLLQKRQFVDRQFIDQFIRRPSICQLFTTSTPRFANLFIDLPNNSIDINLNPEKMLSNLTKKIIMHFYSCRKMYISWIFTNSYVK